MNILFKADKMNARNALINNNIINNVHHYLKVNIPGLRSFRVLPGTWGASGLPPGYPSEPFLESSPYLAIIPNVSKNFLVKIWRTPAAGRTTSL